MKRKAGIISISGFVLTKNEKAIIKAGKPWGIILFKRNIKNMSQCIQLINSIRATINDKKYPILIDEEGGRVTRLSDFLDNSLYNQNYFGDLYSLNQDVGAAVYKNYINSMSIILKKIGININTAPVLDIIKPRTHKIIGNRGFSKNTKIISQLGDICIKSYKNNKIETVIKHIPGHGGATSDTHYKLPIVSDSYEILKTKDFKCFKNKNSLFAMTAHILYKKLDSKNCATHSKIIITKVIRKNIGFKGILMSDDISMKALKYDIYENAKRALEAGCNLVLYCSGKASESQKLLKHLPYIDVFTAKKTSEFYKFLS